jgi:hypothetical protein
VATTATLKFSSLSLNCSSAECPSTLIVHRGNNGLQCKNLEQIHSRQRSLKRFGANAVLAIDLVDSDTPRGEVAMNRRAACCLSVIHMHEDERGFQVQCRRDPKPAIASRGFLAGARIFYPYRLAPFDAGLFLF